MQPRLAERHDGEERPVHHRDAGVFQALAHIAQNDLAQFVFDAEGLEPAVLGFVQNLIGRRIRGVQHKRRAHLAVRKAHAPVAAVAVKALDARPVHDADMRQLCDLLEKIRFQDLRVVGVLLGEERAVTHAALKIFRRGDVVAPDISRAAEAPELLGIRPRKRRARGVDLIELCVHAEPVILVETAEVSRRLDRGGIGARIVIAHMHARLIDISRALEGSIVVFEHRHGFTAPAAQKRRIQTVQPRADDDFIRFHAQ